MNLLVERQFHRVASGLEFRFRRVDRRNRHAPAGIHHVFDKAQRMPFLFLRLPEKMLRQLRQRLRRKMRCNRVILQLSGEFVSDLLVNSVDYFLACKHTESLPRITRMQTDGWRSCTGMRSQIATTSRRVLPSYESAATTDSFLCRIVTGGCSRRR